MSQRRVLTGAVLLVWMLGGTGDAEAKRPFRARWLAAGAATLFLMAGGHSAAQLRAEPTVLHLKAAQAQSVKEPMQIRRWQVARDGEVTLEALERVMNAQGFDKGWPYRFAVGGSIGMHANGSDKLEGVLEGRLRFNQGGDSQVLEPGDLVFVPAGLDHSAENVGDKPVILMLGSRLPEGKR